MLESEKKGETSTIYIDRAIYLFGRKSSGEMDRIADETELTES